jgi:hypothetical protein
VRFSAGVSFSWQPEVNIFAESPIPLFFQIVQIQVGYTHYERQGAFFMRIGFDLFGAASNAVAEKRDAYLKK